MVHYMGRMLLHGLFKRRRMIVWLASSIMGSIIIGSLLWPPIFEATSSVLLEGGDYKELLFPEPQGGRQWTVLTNPKELINTEIEIIRSRPVMERVVRSLNLHLPNTVQTVDTGIPGSLRGIARRFSAALKLVGSGGQPSEEKAFEATVEALRKEVKVEPSIESHVVRITYRSHSPSIASQVANRIAEEYLNQHLVVNLNKSESSFYAEQQQAMEKELVNLQEKLATVMADEGILSFPEQSNALLKKYQTFDVARTTLQQEIIARRSKIEGIQEIRKNNPSVLIPLPEIAKDPIIQDLENSLVNLRFQQKNLGQRYTETTPQIVNLREQIRQIETLIRSQVDQYIERETVELGKFQSEEQATMTTLSDLEQQIKRLPIVEMQLSRLQKQIQDITAALTQLRNKYQDSMLGQAADSRLERAKVVSPAPVPLKPVAPNILLNSALGFILALVISLSMALFLEYCDDSLKAPEDIERFLKRQVLSSVPEL